MGGWFFFLVTVANADIQQNHAVLRLHWQEIISTTFWIVIFIGVHKGSSVCRVIKRIVHTLKNLCLMQIKQMKWGKKKGPVLEIAKWMQRKILTSAENNTGSPKRG